ncbi:MAG: alpha-glucosidase C-terminal domain-containing protein, partial [Gemmiger sp.]|nr:alpha-glucosidase C-terminal domain-containing protein [Gemmiger sp.]
EGDKKNGDPTLRPEVTQPETNALTAWITALAKARTGSEALCYGSYRNIVVQPKQLIFERKTAGERVLVAINADSAPCHLDFNAEAGRATDLITGQMHDFGGGSDLAGYACCFWKTE